MEGRDEKGTHPIDAVELADALGRREGLVDVDCALPLGGERFRVVVHGVVCKWGQSIGQNRLVMVKSEAPGDYKWFHASLSILSKLINSMFVMV